MKIGIYTGGNNSLTLFKFLNRYEHEFVVFYDFINWPIEEKDFETYILTVKKGIDFLLLQGCDKIILPPLAELHFLYFETTYNQHILPLFSDYVLNFCFKFSLIGKIGVVGNFVDKLKSQEYLEKLGKKYKLTSNQKNIEKFNFPFVWRVKEVKMWKYFAINMAWNSFMVNKVVKFDLRYFKDAMVDTVIPMDYGFFNFQKTIYKFFNFKHKTRFHKIDKLEEVWKNYNLEERQYGIKIFFTSTVHQLLDDKRFVWLLQRGKEQKIEFQQIKREIV